MLEHTSIDVDLYMAKQANVVTVVANTEEEQQRLIDEVASKRAAGESVDPHELRTISKADAVVRMKKDAARKEKEEKRAALAAIQVRSHRFELLRSMELLFSQRALALLSLSCGLTPFGELQHWQEAERVKRQAILDKQAAEKEATEMELAKLMLHPDDGAISATFSTIYVTIYVTFFHDFFHDFFVASFRGKRGCEAEES